MTLEVQVGHSVVEEKAREREAQDRIWKGLWPLPVSLPPLSSPLQSLHTETSRLTSNGELQAHMLGPIGCGGGGEYVCDKGDLSWVAEMISRHVFCRS